MVFCFPRAFLSYFGRKIGQEGTRDSELRPGGSSSLNGPDFGHFCADSTAAQVVQRTNCLILGGRKVERQNLTFRPREDNLSNECPTSVLGGWTS